MFGIVIRGYVACFHILRHLAMPIGKACSNYDMKGSLRTNRNELIVLGGHADAAAHEAKMYTRTKKTKISHM